MDDDVEAVAVIRGRHGFYTDEHGQRRLVHEDCRDCAQLALFAGHDRICENDAREVLNAAKARVRAAFDIHLAAAVGNVSPAAWADPDIGDPIDALKAWLEDEIVPGEGVDRG